MSKVLTKQNLQMFLSVLKDAYRKGIDKELEKRIIKRGMNANMRRDDIDNILRSEEALSRFIILFEGLLSDTIKVKNHKDVEKALKIMLPHVQYTIQAIKITEKEISIKAERIGITGLGEMMKTVDIAEMISMSVKDNVREPLTVQVIDSLENLAKPNLNIIMLTLDNKDFWEDKKLSALPFYVTGIGTPEFKFYYPSTNKYGEAVYREATTSKIVNISEINNKVVYRAVVPNKAASKLATCYLYNTEEIDIDAALNVITSGASEIAICKGDIKAYERIGGSETPRHTLGKGHKYAVILGKILDSDKENFMDGWGPISAEFMAQLLTDASCGLFEFTKEALMGYGFQCKFSGVDKSNRTCVSKRFMKRFLEIAVEQGLKVELYNCSSFEEVEFVCDSDTLKAPINFGQPININVAAWNKEPSMPNLGLQMWSKIYMNSPTGYEFILDRFTSQVENIIADMQKPNFSARRATSYDALEKALLEKGYEPIKVDDSIKNTKVKATMDKVNEDMNKFKIPVEGYTTVILPPVINLIAEVNLLGFNEIYYGGYQNAFDQLYDIDHRISVIEAGNTKAGNVEELEVEKLFIMQEHGIEKVNGEYYGRKSCVTKNPTQGRHECHICHCVSLQCIMKRMNENGTSDEDKAIVIEFIESLHLGNSIAPHYKQMKDKLAGLDHDWDKWPIITDRKVVAEVEKGYRNVYCVID